MSMGSLTDSSKVLDLGNGNGINSFVIGNQGSVIQLYVNNGLVDVSSVIPLFTATANACYHFIIVDTPIFNSTSMDYAVCHGGNLVANAFNRLLLHDRSLTCIHWPQQPNRRWHVCTLCLLSSDITATLSNHKPLVISLPSPATQVHMLLLARLQHHISPPHLSMSTLSTRLFRHHNLQPHVEAGDGYPLHQLHQPLVH
jgi:hypothetical protein